MNPRNFHCNLYSDDNFMRMKEYITEDLIANMQSKHLIKEQKDLIGEVDACINDL